MSTGSGRADIDVEEPSLSVMEGGAREVSSDRAVDIFVVPWFYCALAWLYGYLL